MQNVPSGMLHKRRAKALLEQQLMLELNSKLHLLTSQNLLAKPAYGRNISKVRTLGSSPQLSELAQSVGDVPNRELSNTADWDDLRSLPDPRLEADLVRQLDRRELTSSSPKKAKKKRVRGKVLMNKDTMAKSYILVTASGQLRDLKRGEDSEAPAGAATSKQPENGLMPLSPGLWKLNSGARVKGVDALTEVDTTFARATDNASPLGKQKEKAETDPKDPASSAPKQDKHDDTGKKTQPQAAGAGDGTAAQNKMAQEYNKAIEKSKAYAEQQQRINTELMMEMRSLRLKDQLGSRKNRCVKLRTENATLVQSIREMQQVLFAATSNVGCEPDAGPAQKDPERTQGRGLLHDPSQKSQVAPGRGSHLPQLVSRRALQRAYERNSTTRSGSAAPHQRNQDLTNTIREQP